MDKTLQMMKELTDAPGVSGFEAPVRQVMRRYLEPLSDVTTDNLGSIIGRKVGKNGGPKVVLAGHMDEIGFMVTRITDEGYIKFQTLGGWWSQVMLAQRVEIHTRDGAVIGVIGSKPPHILSPDDRRKVYTIPQMFIDVGASSRQEVEEFGIRPGDPIVPIGPLTVMKNEKLLMAKAWDNRFGCALAIEVMRQLQEQEHPNEVYGVGNVQEEVGLRGATTTTNVIAPDIGFAVDTGIAGDTPGIEPDQANAKLGSGPVIVLYDGSMIPHVGLRNFVIDVAEAEGIPFQYDSIAGGGTDAGKMHVFGAGVPSLVIGVPVRYIHTHAAILHRDDFDMAAKLLVEVIRRLDDEMVQQLLS